MSGMSRHLQQWTDNVRWLKTIQICRIDLTMSK